MLNRIRRRISIGLSAVILGLVCGLALAAPAHASLYGRGSYGSCSYGSCTPAPTPTPAPPVIVTTPSGLEVSINLVDGQVIPASGYTITITPLNGAGDSFREARIYLEGALVTTLAPDTDKTVRWFWDPLAHPGTHLKIEIIDTSDNLTTRNFTIRINNPSPSVAPSTKNNGSNTTKPSSNPIANIVPSIAATTQEVYKQLKKTVSDLPAPVVETFPYILFLLLGINLIVLFLHFHREVKEYQTLQAILTRARLLAEQKQVFMALTSHYLRTPLTVLSGGVDLIKNAGAFDAATKEVQMITDRIRSKIEQLLSQTKQLTTTVASTGGNIVAPAHFWQQPLLFIPLILIGFTLVSFNILAVNAGKFSHAQVQLISQIILFTIIALATYQIFRRRQLRQHDHQLLQNLVEQERQIARTRDDLMVQTIQTLSNDLEALDVAKTKLSGTEGSEYIVQGIKRFQNVLVQFAVAERLKGIHAGQTAAPVQLSSLMQQARSSLEPLIAQRGLAVNLINDLTITTADPDLLVRALASVLDNAIAFSRANGTITVTGANTANGPDISVHDDGAGIPPEKVPLIFQPFYKAEGPNDFNHVGMGFSLYLDKLILTYLGGDITLQSEPGHGTTVQFKLNRG